MPEINVGGGSTARPGGSAPNNGPFIVFPGKPTGVATPPPAPPPPDPISTIDLKPKLIPSGPVNAHDDAMS